MCTEVRASKLRSAARVHKPAAPWVPSMPGCVVSTIDVSVSSADGHKSMERFLSLGQNENNKGNIMLNVFL